MIKYLKELRHRFVLTTLCWISVFFIIYTYREIALFEIINSSSSKPQGILTNFIFTNVTELFSIYLELAYTISNQIITVYFFFNFISFLSPGLYYSEYKFLDFYFKIVLFFWLVSMISLNNVIAPIVWEFFLSFQNSSLQHSVDIQFEAKISEYLTFFIDLYYYCNIQFQFFTVLIFIISYLNKIKKFLKSYRKGFYLLFLIIGTLFTPSDVISQLISFLSLVLFFELIVLIRIFIVLNLEGS